MSVYENCEPYFEDIHPAAADGTTSVDVLELVGDCPIPRGQDKNEIGVGCKECLAETPDRAGLCSANQYGWFAISPEEVVYFGIKRSGRFCSVRTESVRCVYGERREDGDPSQ